MLHEFISRNRQELIELCRAKVASRLVHAATPVELEHGVPLFLDQLVKTLQFEEAESAAGVRRISGRFGATQPDRSEMAAAARMHGRDLLKFGFSLQQVVYDYGDICQAISELAFEDNAAIKVSEFQTLNRCLDNAIAGAVTEFSGLRESQISSGKIDPNAERRRVHADELMSLISAADLAVIAIKSGKIGISGATGAVLDRCLIDLRVLVQRSFQDVIELNTLDPSADTAAKIS